MGLKKTLRKLGNAVPVILAYAPAVIDAARQVRKAVKKPKAAPETPQA